MKKVRVNTVAQVLCTFAFFLILTSCSDDSKNGVSNDEHKDYVASTEARSDLELFYEFALKADNLKMSIILAMSENGGLFNNSVDELEGDSIYTSINGIVEKSDAYEKALLRLENNGFFSTTTSKVLKKGVEGMSVVKAGKDFLDACKGSGQTVRERTMEVFLSDGVKSDANRKALFDELPAPLKKGVSDYKQWWKNFNAGEYDASSGNIFNSFIAGKSQASEDFLFEAAEKGYTNTTNVLEIAPRLIEAGFNLVTETAGNILPGAMSIGVNIGTNVAKIADILVVATGKKISEVSADIAEGILNMIPGYGDVKATVDLIPSYEDIKANADIIANYIERKINFYLPLSGNDVGRIAYNDNDETEAITLIAVEQMTGEVTLAMGSSTENSVSANLPEGDYKVSVVDENGDKFTEEVSIKAGEKIEKEIKTRESEIFEKKISSSSVKTSSSFSESSSSFAKSSSNLAKSSSSFIVTSSSKTETHTEVCDVSEGSSKYMSCLFMGEWNVESEEIVCETDREDEMVDGAKCTWTFEENGKAEIFCIYANGEFEGESHPYTANLLSGKITITMDGSPMEFVISILDEESLNILSEDFVTNGEKCHFKIDFRR